MKRRANRGSKLPLNINVQIMIFCICVKFLHEGAPNLFDQNLKHEQVGRLTEGRWTTNRPEKYISVLTIMQEHKRAIKNNKTNLGMCKKIIY